MASQTIRTPRSHTKTAKAIAIFCEMTGFSRALVIDRLKTDVGLSAAAASTYYQNCRKKAGMTKSRETASATK